MHRRPPIAATLASALLTVVLLPLACKPTPREEPQNGAASGSPSAASVQSAPISPASVASADVVSHASEVWTADGPKVLAGEAVDGDALRKQTHDRILADKSPVTVLTGGTPRELGRRLCEAVVPKRPASTPVLLKPNMGGFEWFKAGSDNGVTGRTTDPEFVRGVIQCLKARGHTKITIAEGWGAKHADWEKLVQVSGYGAMAAEEKVALVAMDDDGTFDKMEGKPGLPLAIAGIEKTNVPTLLMPKILAEHLDHGLYLSLPKIKHHRFGVASVGIKGMQGTVMLSDKSPAYNNKWRMHKELTVELAKQAKSDPEARKSYVKALETFAERIATVLELEAPHAVLAEGAPAMMGDGFRDLVPVTPSVAIGGTNVIAVDRIAHEYLGVWDNAALAKELGGHRTSPLLEAAAKRFGVSLDGIGVVGDGKDLIATKRPLHFVGMAGFTLESAAGAAVTGDASPPEAIASKVVGAEPVVDGRDDPAWAAAKPVQFASNWRGETTGVGTTARFLWSAKGLYARFDLSQAGLHTDTARPITEERAKLYEEDCVELFLAPNAAKKTAYAELEIGPYGHFLDLWVDREAKKSDVAWSADAQIATTRDPLKHLAIVEVLVAAREIRAALVPGAHLPMNLFRMEGVKGDSGGRKYLAWSPTNTKTPNFHVPEAFGVLRVVGGE